MRIIDLSTWKRRTHYEMYSGLDFPYLNINANVDVSKLVPWCKENGFSLFSAIAYITSRSANDIPELRQRIRGDQVVEHEAIRASFTVLTENDTFGFATIEYTPDFLTFNQRVLDGIERTKQNPTIHDEPGRDDMIFLTTVTWVSFTQITHPVPLNPPDSFPRIAWGKYFQQEGKLMMPLSLMANHALVDGLHVGRFFEGVQGLLDAPEKLKLNH
jgi:chloramphenicol O-acetyltransferase type A